jgi:hypothetical protein
MKLSASIAGLVAVAALAGCTDADVASKNLSKAPFLTRIEPLLELVMHLVNTGVLIQGINFRSGLLPRVTPTILMYFIFTSCIRYE